MKPILPVVVVLALAAGAYAYRSRGQASAEGDLVLYGNVDVREVELAFRQPGRLVRVLVDEGASVTAGALVAEIDAAPYRDALAAAEAQMQAAKAEKDKLDAGSRPQEIQRAEESVRLTQAVLTRAESDLARQGGLSEKGAASVQIYEAARAARDEAAAALESAKQSLSLLREGARQEDRAAAAARLSAAEAARAQAQTALDDARLLAPTDGVVLARVREPGSMVTSRDTVLTLSLRDPVYVRAYVAEPDLGRLPQGSQVLVASDSTGKVYHGTIGFVSPRAEFTPKTVETTDLRTDLVYRVRIVVSDGDGRLLQGMPVTVHAHRAPQRSD